MANETIVRKVQRYVLQHPEVRECLQRGIINYSSLAREICGRDTQAFEATVVALRRLSQVERTRSAPSQKRFLSFLKAASTVVRSRVAVIGIRRPDDFGKLIAVQAEIERQRGDMTLVTGHQMITLMTGAEHAALIRSRFRKLVIFEIQGLAQLILLLPQRVVETPGFGAYLLGLLGSRNINVFAEATCSGEHIIAIREEDLVPALSILSGG
jgi:hypothetical protein